MEVGALVAVLAVIAVAVLVLVVAVVAAALLVAVAVVTVFVAAAARVPGACAGSLARVRERALVENPRGSLALLLESRTGRALGRELGPTISKIWGLTRSCHTHTMMKNDET